MIEMENFKKYPKIRQIGHKENEGVLTEGDIIEITEKFDGSNFRFMENKGKIIFGSRTQQLTSDEGEETNVPKNFKRVIEYLRKKLTKIQLPENHIFFGENMVKHSLDYDWDKIPPFLGFDIYDTVEEKFIDNYRQIFEELGLRCVPLLKTGKWGLEITDKDLKIPKSKYADNFAEGICIKNYGRTDEYGKQLFAKKVSERFREKLKNNFGQSKKYAEDDTSWFVAKYCTNARIEKAINKLIDEGHELEMKMMHELPTKVYKDIWEESWEEFAFSKKIIDTNKFKKEVSTRCLAVLKTEITNIGLVS